SEIDVVIASYDREFNYRKLQIAFDAIWYHRRAILIATNPDPYCPYPGGRAEPDAAGVIAAITATTGAKCQAVMGKPSAVMVQEAIRGWGFGLEKVIMIGDRLATDIAMAKNAGMASALVLTGDSKLAEVNALAEDQKPDYVLDQLADLIPS
ncbi:MAG: HAD family hydrolase, partial [Actinomycetales bacterium]